MNETTIAAASETEYDRLELLIQERVKGALGPLFQTNATGLFGIYLNNLPAEYRQHYNCRACEKFVETCGGLVTINDVGDTKSLLWGNHAFRLPSFFIDSVYNTANTVEAAKVTGVFLSSTEVWGKPVTGRWTHLSGIPSDSLIHRDPLKFAFQRAAEIREDFVLLKKGLTEFPIGVLFQAVRVLEADALDRSEKTLGAAKWLLALHQQLESKNKIRRDNLCWKAAATAPPGWCHVRSTMIGTLLQDIADGLPYESVARRWASKMHPLQYQRPTAPPSDGAIKQAEKIVAELGTAGALSRRFARLEDLLDPLWLPRRPVEEEFNKSNAGVFDHLKEGKSKIVEMELPARTLIWEKFRDEVLPNALQIQIDVPNLMLPFCGLVTAADPNSPPVLQWDSLDGVVNEKG